MTVGWNWPVAHAELAPGDVYAFVNRQAIETRGPIESGLRAGLAASAPPSAGLSDLTRARDLLAGVVVVRVAEPRFNSARTVLENPEVTDPVRDAVAAALATVPPAALAAVWARCGGQSP